MGMSAERVASSAAWRETARPPGRRNPCRAARSRGRGPRWRPSPGGWRGRCPRGAGGGGARARWRRSCGAARPCPCRPRCGGPRPRRGASGRAAPGRRSPPALRCRLRPATPLAQKTQPIAQPTWVEMHMGDPELLAEALAVDLGRPCVVVVLVVVLGRRRVGVGAGAGAGDRREEHRLDGRAVARRTAILRVPSAELWMCSTCRPARGRRRRALPGASRRASSSSTRRSLPGGGSSERPPSPGTPARRAPRGPRPTPQESERSDGWTDGSWRANKYCARRGGASRARPDRPRSFARATRGFPRTTPRRGRASHEAP